MFVQIEYRLRGTDNQWLVTARHMKVEASKAEEIMKKERKAYPGYDFRIKVED